MFKYWFEPLISLTNEQLEKRAGLFWRQTIRRVDVELIDAIQMDCVTHHQVLIRLWFGGRIKFDISELDQDFGLVMKRLNAWFPGIDDLQPLLTDEPFSGQKKVLWKRWVLNL
jgi:hypothetical protein